MADKYKRSKCPKCGAAKESTAAEKCSPERDYSDEWTCPRDYYPTDKKGYFIVPDSKQAQAALAQQEG